MKHDPPHTADGARHGDEGVKACGCDLYEITSVLSGWDQRPTKIPLDTQA